MTAIHLIEGPVGAGKSTFATRLAFEQRAPRLDLDAWMVTLFSPDRPDDGFVPWYQERKQRCLQQIWSVTTELIEAGSSVVLELGLVGRSDRDAFYARVDATDHRLLVYVLDAPEAVRRQRVRERNVRQDGSFKMVVPDEIFDIATHAWEPPDESEAAARRIHFVQTG